MRKVNRVNKHRAQFFREEIASQIVYTVPSYNEAMRESSQDQLILVWGMVLRTPSLFFVMHHCAEVISFKLAWPSSSSQSREVKEMYECLHN